MKTLTAIVLGIGFSTSVYAINGDDVLHETAHFGGTYMVTHGTEVVCKKLIGKEHKVACTIAGAVISQGLNVAYKAQENFPSDTKRSLLSGAAGTAAAVLMISIDF